VSLNPPDLGPQGGLSLAADRLLAFAEAGIGRQVLVYGLISALALGLDVALYLGLAGAGMRPAYAAVAGYGLGLIIHFVLSSRIAFNAAATGKATVHLFWQFALSGLAGLAVTAATVGLLTDLFGFPPATAKAAAVLLSFAGVFALRRTLVFASSQAR
jgi:putative flippase GtrA